MSGLGRSLAAGALAAALVAMPAWAGGPSDSPPPVESSATEDRHKAFSAWGEAFTRPAAGNRPTPEWVISRELSAAEAGTSLDAFRAEGFRTVVVVAGKVGPFFDETSPTAQLAPLAGTLFPQLETILDEAANRGMQVWYETFSDLKLDVENAVLKEHPEFQGQQLSEDTRGSDYSIVRAEYDRLNPAATRAYVEALLGEMQRRFPERLGSTLLGIWDDESYMLSATASPSNGPKTWSAALPAAFLAAKGYRIDTPANQERLFHGDDARSRQVRVDYWDVVSTLFQGHFAIIRDWLEQRGMQLIVEPLRDTGRVAEDMWTEGSVFRQYAGSSVPGVDFLYNDDDQGGGARTDWGVVLKQASSAALLYGKFETQYEPFGWSQPSLSRMRALTDRAFVRGATLVQPAFYVDRSSPAAGAANAAALAPDLFTTNVMWPHQDTWGRYAARLRTLLHGAKPVQDLLVLHPQTSAWAWNPEGYQDHGTDHAGGSMTYLNVATALTDRQYGFSLAPEWILTESGTTIRDGAVRRAGQAFTTVVLPEVDTLTDAQADALLEFARSGGSVLAVTRVPTMSADGDDQHVKDVMATLFGSAPTPGLTVRSVGDGTGAFLNADLGSTTDFRYGTTEVYAALYAALDRLEPRDVSIDGARQVGFRGHTANEAVHVRRDGHDVVFVTNYPDPRSNVSYELGVAGSEDPAGSWGGAATRLVVTVRAEGVPELWDPASGQRRDAPAWWTAADGRISVEVPVSAQGGMAVVFRDASVGGVPPHVTEAGTGVTSVTRSGDAVTVTADWPASPWSTKVPVAVPGRPTTWVPLRSTTSLPPVTVNGPWRFDLTARTGGTDVPAGVGQRGPGSWTLPDAADPGHPGVTGTGVYSSLDLPVTLGALEVPASYLRPDVALLLDLGGVRDIAEATVRGQRLGARLWPPYVYDVTGVVRAGANPWSVAVTNTTANGSVGIASDPLRWSGLIDAPRLVPRLRVTGSARIGQDEGASPAPVGNLLPNPGLERADATGLAPEGWVTEGGAGTMTTADAHRGAGAATLIGGARGVSWWRPQVGLPVREGQQYRLSGWFRGESAAPGAGGRLGVRWLDASGRLLIADTGPGVRRDGTWSMVGTELTAPHGAVTAVPLFGFDADVSSTGSVMVDDLVFGPVLP